MYPHETAEDIHCCGLIANRRDRREIASHLGFYPVAISVKFSRSGSEREKMRGGE